MKLTIVINFLILHFELNVAAISKKVNKRNDYEYKTEIYHEYVEDPRHNFRGVHSTSVENDGHHQSLAENHPTSNDYYQNFDQDSHYHISQQDENNVNKEKNYNLGSGLRSIAQGSANQAHSAVENQHAAAKQAAYLAKNSLAQTALQAAATAQAALTGKEVLLYELEQQLTDAKNSVEAEIAQLELASKASKSAQQAAIQASNHVSALSATLNSAKSVATQAEQTAQKSASELESQTSMVEKAKSRQEALEGQLKAVLVDFAATKKAAIKATVSAQKAQYNAEEAAAHVTDESKDNFKIIDENDDSHSSEEIKI